MAKRKKKPPWIKSLGKKTDAAIAEQFEVDLSTVRKKRWELGIASFSPRRPETNWTREMDALLSTATDKEVARKLGLTAHMVYTRRRFLRIPSYSHLKKKGRRR